MSNGSLLCPAASRSVAVIGAGAAGLVAGRELRRAAHSVVIFEQKDEVGGTWIYDPTRESDLLGHNPVRQTVHSSLYASLRTNLPRETMGFRDYPFVAVDSRGRDTRRFPGHSEVMNYLKDFAREFNLYELIRFNTQVIRVKDNEEGKWGVRCLQRIEGVEREETYDAVVVCNGHFTQPRVAEVPGMSTWPGKQMHSHNYRVPEEFRDQVVVIIGNASSAVDISREISGVAKEVHIAVRSGTAVRGYGNIWIHPMIESLGDDRSVVFFGGDAVHADVILHCTGYEYHFPFLETSGVVFVEDNCVGPLYKHVFPPALAPWISFVGLPWKTIPFQVFEYQSKWIAGVLAGEISLPSREMMLDDVNRFYSDLQARGIPKRYTHNMSDYEFEYNDWLANECGCEASEEWRKQMYYVASENKHIRPETYRDEWEDQDLIAEARSDFFRIR